MRRKTKGVKPLNHFFETGGAATATATVSARVPITTKERLKELATEMGIRVQDIIEACVVAIVEGRLKLEEILALKEGT